MKTLINLAVFGVVVYIGLYVFAALMVATTMWRAHVTIGLYIIGYGIILYNNLHHENPKVLYIPVICTGIFVMFMNIVGCTFGIEPYG